MRKALKIKAILLFIGWLVIFLHSIVPHNHLHEYNQELKSFAHIIGHLPGCEQEHQIISSVENVTDGICHFSDSLFHKLTCAEHFINTGDIISISNSWNNSKCLFFESGQTIPDSYYFYSSLRAPPPTVA